MKKFKTIYGLLVSTSILMISCNGSTNQIENNSSQEKQDSVSTNEKNKIEFTAPEVIEKDEEKMRLFLYSTKNTYGWETKSNNISFDFFKDGRLHIQGSEGEATMWEGKWDLKGDQLTMVRPDLEKSITVTAKISGDNLLLDNIIYNRYKP